MSAEDYSPIELMKFRNVINDPVLWAKAFITIFNTATKINEPWTARWYQVEMLRDQSLKKVARCGRRTGKKIALPL